MLRESGNTNGFQTYATQFAVGAIEGLAKTAAHSFEKCGYEVVCVLAGETVSLSGLSKAVGFALGAARAVQQLTASQLASPDSLMRNITSSQASSSEASTSQKQSDFISAAETATLQVAEWASETVRVGSKWPPSGIPIFTREREGVVAGKVLMLEMASANSPESVQSPRISISPGSAASNSSICSSALASEMPADSVSPQPRKRLHFSAPAESDSVGSVRLVEQPSVHSDALSPAGETELLEAEAPLSAKEALSISLPDATTALTISGVQLNLNPPQEPGKGFEAQNEGLSSTDPVLTSGGSYEPPKSEAAQLETPGRCGAPAAFRTAEQSLGNWKLLQASAGGSPQSREVPGTPEVPGEPVKLSRAPALTIRDAILEKEKAGGEAGSVAKSLNFEAELAKERPAEDERTKASSAHSASDREELQTPRFGPVHRKESQIGKPWEGGLESAGFVLVDKVDCTLSLSPAGGAAAKPSAPAAGSFEDEVGEDKEEGVAPSHAAEKKLSPEEVLAAAKRALRLNKLKPLATWNCQVTASGGMSLLGELAASKSMQSEIGRMRGSLAVLRALRPDRYQGKMLPWLPAWTSGVFSEPLASIPSPSMSGLSAPMPPLPLSASFMESPFAFKPSPLPGLPNYSQGSSFDEQHLPSARSGGGATISASQSASNKGPRAATADLQSDAGLPSREDVEMDERMLSDGGFAHIEVPDSPRSGRSKASTDSDGWSRVRRIGIPSRSRKPKAGTGERRAARSELPEVTEVATAVRSGHKRRNRPLFASSKHASRDWSDGGRPPKQLRMAQAGQDSGQRATLDRRLRQWAEKHKLQGAAGSALAVAAAMGVLLALKVVLDSYSYNHDDVPT